MTTGILILSQNIYYYQNLTQKNKVSAMEILLIRYPKHLMTAQMLTCTK
jgi:hypothetical protein